LRSHAFAGSKWELSPTDDDGLNADRALARWCSCAADRKMLEQKQIWAGDCRRSHEQVNMALTLPSSPENITSNLSARKARSAVLDNQYTLPW